MNYKKIILSLVFVTVFALGTAAQVSAHVVVRPGEVGVGAYTNFTVSVPTEEDVPTVQVRLVIPEGLKSVRPNVKPGWSIELKKVTSGDTERVSEIIWSGGSIPVDQRDEFVFSAQTPAEESTLVWKAYQTYGDGDIVAWENGKDVIDAFEKNNPPKEGEEDNHDAPRPYSETKVINDLAASDAKDDSMMMNHEGKGDSKSFDPALVISVIALGAAFGSLWMQKKKKSK